MSEQLKVTGKVKKVYPTNQISESFKKRDLIIETDENYPQIIKLEFTQNAVDKVDGLKAGQEVTAFYNLRGREFKGKDGNMMYFVSLNCWRIEKGAVFAPEPISTIPADDSSADQLPF